MDCYYGYCFGFVHPLRKEGEVNGRDRYLLQRKRSDIDYRKAKAVKRFFSYVQQLPTSQLSVELSLLFEYLLKNHKLEHDQFEDLIEELDNDVLNDYLQNFNQRIATIRNRIRYLLQ